MGTKLSIKKIFIRTLLFLSIYYTLALIVSFALSFKMTSIIYNSTAFGVVLEEYKLDFLLKKAEHNFYNFQGEQIKHIEVELSSSQEWKFKTTFAISLAPLWRKSYSNPFIMDGDQWDIARIYNHKRDITYGSNAYPLTYLYVLYIFKGVFI